MSVQEIIAIILATAGFVFSLISVAGIFRFPDFFSRLHAQGIGDTLGSMLITLALIVLAGFQLLSVKILIACVIIMFTGPLGTNLIMLASIRERNFQDYNRKIPKEEADK